MRLWSLAKLVAGGGVLVVVGSAALMVWPLLWPPDPDASVQLVNGRLIGEASGYVGRIDRDARTVDVSASLVGWRPVVLIVNETTAITVQNREGGFGDLWKDMPVRVSYELVGDARLARSIEVVTTDGEFPRPVVNGAVTRPAEGPSGASPSAAAPPSADVPPPADVAPPASPAPAASLAAPASPPAPIASPAPAAPASPEPPAKPEPPASPPRAGSPAAPKNPPAPPAKPEPPPSAARPASPAPAATPSSPVSSPPPAARASEPAPARPAPKPASTAAPSRPAAPSPAKPSPASVAPASQDAGARPADAARRAGPSTTRRAEPRAATPVPSPRSDQAEVDDGAAAIDWLLGERGR